MKRALKKRVKAELENTPSDDAPVEQTNAINTWVNRRVPTKAAMIGLAISMGATSLLVTRQSDQAVAAEPVGNQNTASIPTASDTEVKFTPAKGQETQIVSTVSVPESPIVVEPTAISQVAGLRAKWQSVADGKSVQALPPVVVPTSPQKVEAQSTPSAETNNVQTAKKLGETVSNAYGVAENPTTYPTAQPQSVAAVDNVEPEVNAQLKAQQEFALNQLQEKSHRLRKSLVDLRSSEAQELSPVASISTPPVTVLKTTPQLNKHNVAAAEQPASLGNPNREKLVSRLKQRLNEAKVPASIPTPDPATATVVTSSATATYEVKPGDTLAAIASDYGTSVSELVKANNLGNPDQLKINQRLTIPVAENLTTASQQSVAINQSTVLSSGTIKGTEIDANQSVVHNSSVYVETPVVAKKPIQTNKVAESIPNNLIANNSGVTVLKPLAATNNQTQTSLAAETITNNSTANNISVTVPTPVIGNSLIQIDNESTAAKSATSHATRPEITSTGAYGVGGDTPVPKAFAEIQLAQQQNPAVKNAKNQRLRSLQAEIEKLREKYRAQQTGGTLVSQVNETENYPVEVPVTNTDGAVQIAVPKANNAAVPSPIFRGNNTAIPIPVPQPGMSSPNARQAQPLFRANRRPVNDPVNPELLPNQNRVIPSVDGSQSLGNMRGTTVSPQLPPLAAVDRYLPRPIDETLPPPSSGSTSYIWPAKGVLTSGFGPRWGRMHKGIDIANGTGTPIYASADGIVERAGWNNGGYGNLVDIRHADGSLTRYGHNSKIVVQRGQQVYQGQTIALMGSTGFSTGPHSHFEIHASGKGAVNPIAFLPRL